MRALLLSVHPRHAQAILRGDKRFEYRRRPPKVDLSTEVVIYATKPVGKVLGYCWTHSTLLLPLDELWARTYTGGCITSAEFDDYFRGLSIGGAIELDTPSPLTTPLDLHTVCELRRPPQSWQWLERPPQSR